MAAASRQQEGQENAPVGHPQEVGGLTIYCSFSQEEEEEEEVGSDQDVGGEQDGKRGGGTHRLFVEMPHQNVLVRKRKYNAKLLVERGLPQYHSFVQTDPHSARFDANPDTRWGRD